MNLKNFSRIDETKLIVIPIKNENLLNNTAEFVLDTGAQTNLIKRKALNSSATVNPNIIYDLVSAEKVYLID